MKLKMTIYKIFSLKHSINNFVSYSLATSLVNFVGFTIHNFTYLHSTSVKPKQQTDLKPFLGVFIKHNTFGCEIIPTQRRSRYTSPGVPGATWISNAIQRYK